MKKKTLFRSSKSGKVVTKKFAEEHPATTEKEEVLLQVPTVHVVKIQPLLENADMNEIRAKINEITNFING